MSQLLSLLLLTLLCTLPSLTTPTNPRISGGTIASPGEFPFAVAFVSQSSKQSYCSGSLINETFILTAAHCLFTGRSLDRIASFGVVAGYEKIAENGIVTRELRRVRQYWVHPEYVANDLSRNVHDVAIVELVEPVRDLKPILLLESQQNYTTLEAQGTTLTVQGWGSTPNARSSDVLLKTNIELYSQSRCLLLLNKGGYVTSRMVCGAGSNNRDACVGDSGGALLGKYNGEDVIVGIVSFGIGDCGENSLGGYTRVSAYLDYVRGVMRGEYEATVSGAAASRPWIGAIVAIVTLSMLVI